MDREQSLVLTMISIVNQAIMTPQPKRATLNVTLRFYTTTKSSKEIVCILKTNGIMPLPQGKLS